MASKLSPATPRPKMQRGSGLDAERISPSTKTGAAGMLGDNSPKAIRSPRSFGTEKKSPVSRGAELQQVQEELAKTKEQLSLMEKSKSNLLQDLARSKRQLEDLNSKLQDANELSKKDKLRAEEMEHASFTAAEDWQAELEIMRKQYEAAVLDLQTSKQAMENLKHELFVCIEAKDEAVRLAGEAMNAAESTAKRVEEMSAELLVAKGSFVVADSASARDDELLVDPSSAQEGLEQIMAICDKSTEEATILLAAKEAELQSSLPEVSHLRSQLESVKQELAQAQKLVDQLTVNNQSSKLAEAVLTAKEAELQQALQEASHFRSETESMRQELSLIQESIMQHKIDDKSMKMEAASLLTRKDAEFQNAIQEASQLRSEIVCLKQELALAQESVMQQTGGPDALELYQTESDKNFAQLSDITFEVERLSSELKHAKVTENKLTMELANAISEIEQLKKELAAASEAKEKAQVAENAAVFHSNKLIAEVGKSKESELAALVSLSGVSTELKEAQENLAKANLEGSMLAGFLDSLKSDFERIQLELATMEKIEAQASERVESLSLELTKMMEASWKESNLLNEQVASAQAALAALKVDAERQRLELHDTAKKEALANVKVLDVTRSLQNAESELAELKRQQSSASQKSLVLAEQLDTNVKEMSEMKEREVSMNARLVSLIQALEEKEHEVIEWERKVGISDSASAVIMLDLEKTKAELLELKERESCVSTKAAALSVVLAFLTDKNEARLIGLREKEAYLDVKVEALNGDLMKTNLDLEEALKLAKAAKDEADKLQISLELATLEVDRAREERQKASAEAARSKKDASAALLKLRETETEAEKALKAARAAESEVEKQSQEIKSLTLNLQAAQDEHVLAKGEVKSLRDKLRDATPELQAVKEEMEHLRREAQASREDAEMLQSTIVMEKEQAVIAKDMAQAAREEVEKMKEEMNALKLNEERTQSLSKSSEDRLQDALKELQTLKLNATAAQIEPSLQIPSMEMEGESMRPREELKNLKVKVQQTEEQLALALKEIENSDCKSQKMLSDLETMKLEKEANEKALAEVHQHLADMEKAKSNLEAEIQRLLDESKQWQTVKDAIDIPIHSEALGRSFLADCRDEKPQPDSPHEVSERPISPLQKSADGDEELAERQEKVMKEHITLREDFACLSLRKEDGTEKEDCFVRDDASLYDESASVPMKKKKKTLLVRLGTLLEKKKHASQHTP